MSMNPDPADPGKLPASTTSVDSIPQNDGTHGSIIIRHMRRFDDLSDIEKTQLVLLDPNDRNAIPETGDRRAANLPDAGVIEEKRSRSNLKFWTVMILLIMVSVNVSAILLISVHTGTMQGIEPVNSLIKFAAEILKTVFAA